MKLTNIFMLLSGAISLLACTNPKKHTYWVSGIKIECSRDSIKTECLSIYKGTDIKNAVWEDFPSDIVGFNFEEGYLKKIVVKEELLDPQALFAEGLPIKYTLVKELKKQVDNRAFVEGEWTLAELNNSPIGSSVVLPTIKLSLEQMKISGLGSCNIYNSSIENISQKKIHFGIIASTRMACGESKIENEYFRVLEKVASYIATESTLTFYNRAKKETLSFIKVEEKEANQILHDIWVAVSINGEEFEKMDNMPNMEINLTENSVMGTDGCNNYSGGIEKVTESTLVFGAIASTLMACEEMTIPDKFNKAMTEVAYYRLEELNLILLDKNKKEVLIFLKVD